MTPNHPTPGEPPRTSRWQRLARVPTTAIFVVSVVIAVLVLWLTGALGGIAGAVRRADVGLLLSAVPIYVGSLWVLAWRWHVLVAMAGGRSHLPRAAEAFLTSVVINYAAPIGLAVPSRAALTRRALGLNASQTGTIALWEIVADVLVLGIGTALWLVLADGAPAAVRRELAGAGTAYLVAVAVMAALGLVAIAFLARKPAIRERVAGIGRRIITAPSRRPGEAVKVMTISVAYWALQGIVLWILLVALRVDVTATFVLGFTALPILVGMLSPVPGGSGVREGLMYVVARLSGLGNEADAILAAALIYRFALFGAIPLLFVANRIWLNRDPGPAVPLHPQDERMSPE